MSREHDVVTLSGAEYDALLSEAEEAARLKRALGNLESKWLGEVAHLEDMKSRGDLTADWGECALISARKFARDVVAARSITTGGDDARD